MRDPEVGKQRMPVRKQNVLWLYIAMNESVSMRVVETVAYFTRNLDCIFDGEFSLAIEPVAQ